MNVAMKHKEKVKKARKISGLQKGHFKSYEWQARKRDVAERVRHHIEAVRAMIMNKKDEN